MSLDKLHQLVGSVTKVVEDNQKLATPILAAKLAKYTAAYPHDQTIGTMARVIDRMVDNNTLFIRKADLKSLYTKLYSRGTQFGDLFQEELGITSTEPEVTTYQRDESIQNNPYNFGDQILANALESVFDKHTPLKMYSQPVANKAIKVVGSTLDVWNLRPTAMSVSDGNDKFIVIKADYETPKGVTSFYVPVEVENTNDVHEPEVFMANAGPQDLNHLTIKSYLTNHAGSKLKFDGTSILSALTKAASENKEVSGAELAAIRMNSARQTQSAFSQGQVVGLKVEAAAEQDVVLPKSDEFASFEERFNSPQGIASWEFGQEIVTAARNHIARELVSLGYSKPQIVVSKSDKNTIFYSVALDSAKVAFTVPVKISADKKLTKPTIMLCNGSISTFDADGITKLVTNNQTDRKAAQIALADLKPSDIVNDVRTAMEDGNLSKAEDALSVLAGSGDQKAYDTAFKVYMNGLSGVKTASTKCSRMIKSAVSEHLICSHTGLPVNKVYQDKHGHCHPLYRQGMDETYEGASFINAKIFG